MAKADKRARKRANQQAAAVARAAAAKRAARMRTLRLSGIGVAVVIIIVAIVAITGNKKSKAKPKASKTAASTTTTTVPLPAGCKITTPKTHGNGKQYKAAPPMTIDTTKTYIATMTTSCGTVQITLDAAHAPKTVNSFVYLARQGFYNGLSFQRIAKDFVIQGGDPKGDGTGGPGYTLPDEPPPNGYKALSVAMANSGPNTTGSQFFFVLNTTAAQGLVQTPGKYLYSDLGQVTGGADVVAKLGTLYNRDQSDADPSTQKTAYPLYMFKVTISEK
jgi:cyclophilin family peptidyl-prolyl cis-trans isomerase